MFAHIQPQAGRLVRRTVSGGAAWVGVLQLPDSFVPQEGVAYVARVSPAGLVLDPTPVSPPLEQHMLSYGVSDLMRQAIWPRPATDGVLPVRFIQAFPKDNIWTVFGPTPHLPPTASPDHAWFDVKSTGTLEPIDPPLNASGVGLGQLLTSYPVWPGPGGELYALSQTQSALRPVYLQYHRLLASAARDPEISSNLEKLVARSPEFRDLSIGSIDRLFCAYLAQKEEAGLLDEDRPRATVEFQDRAQATACLVRALDADNSKPRPPRLR